jgi:hypothetical protein
MNQQKLAEKVLSKLGTWDQGTVSAVDQQNVTDAYDGVYEVLKDEGLVTWSATEDVPTKFEAAIIMIVTSQLKSDYRQAVSAIDAAPIHLHPATMMIRRQLATPYVPEVTTATYY